MYLTRDEEKSLNGENGETMASAYKILLAIGMATGAEKLVPIKWAHLSGVNYNTIGDAGVEFLEKFSRNAKVAVKTTLNPMGFDRNKPTNLPKIFTDQQMRIVRAYENMGTTPSFTCIPYETFDMPDRGSAVSFAESNAAIYSNSVLGLLTNKESSLSALASSVTGKAPYSDLRIEEFRHPKVSVKPTVKLNTEVDHGLLGYFAGKMLNDTCIAFDDIKEKTSIINMKSLSAAIGTSGICGMFTSEEKTNEVISYGREESNKIKDEINTAEDGDIIALGSPQLGISEINFLSKLVEGKRFLKRCMIFCPRAVYNQATNTGLIDRLQKSGVQFICDSCTCLTPLITRNDFDSVITNSIKGAYYLNHSNRIGVALKDMKSIVKEYTD
ncbi:MAG TPA: aconitase X catalytic domain-containing protein [Nitrososphaeraceae archaeon]|jgi:predicted aconitase|nr:aconitase X catalytic domain-containing protein [Nitrososphaeraceae archaeon]